MGLIVKKSSGPERLPLIPPRPATMKKSKSAVELSNGYMGRFVLKEMLCSPTTVSAGNSS